MGDLPRHTDFARTLEMLAEKIAAIERPDRRPCSPAVRTGWPAVDALLTPGASCSGGLITGAVHEWFDKDGEAGSPHDDDTKAWAPPLSVLIHLAFQSILGDPHRAVIWIGRRCHPYIRSLTRDRGRDRRLLEQSIFIDPPTADDRLWAIDLAARCPAVAAVVADGGALDMAASRRLQLAAQAGSALVLLARPAGDLARLSAAATRWVLSTSLAGRFESPECSHRGLDPLTTPFPRWTVHLLRCKGVQPMHRDARTKLPFSFALELDRETGALTVPSDVVDRSRATKTPARRIA